MNKQERREWRICVLGADMLGAAMTPAERLVLLALETFADYPEGTNARPGVALLAEMCGLGERVVRYALDCAVELKLIEQTARANPKAHKAAVYRLLPRSVSTGTSVPLETDPADGFNRHERAFQPARDDVSSGTDRSFNRHERAAHQSIDTNTEHQSINTKVGARNASHRAPLNGENWGVVDARTLTYNPWGCKTPDCGKDSYDELDGYCLDCHRARRPL